MIFLDTNLVSELMKASRDRHPGVVAYLAVQDVTNLCIPSIAVAEIRFGIHRLPAGQRRVEIEAAFEALLQAGFAQRIINFDANCAAHYATARVARQKAGRSVSTEDALIGGMALAYGATLVTRNTDDFTGYGLNLINPWQP